MKSLFYSFVLACAFYSVAVPLTAQNLITNGDFELGNVGFTSGYTYSPTSTSNTATYAIVFNPHDTHSGGSSFGDHTTGTGLMMACNGSTSTNKFIWNETVAVETNRTYLFIGWGASWGRSGLGGVDQAPAILVLLVNGQQINSGMQVPATNGIWLQFSSYWNSGTNTQALLQIRDARNNSLGNDFAIDDLSFHWLDSNNPMVQATPNLVGSGVEIHWPSVTDQVYQVQWSPDLNPLHWFDLGVPVTGTGADLFAVDKQGTAVKKFYRVQVVQ